MENMTETIMEIRNLKTYFPIRSGLLQRTVGHVKAVDSVDLSIEKGEIFGLVGESGSGKTTLARSILRLIETTSGQVIFDGTDTVSYTHLTLPTKRIV